MGTSLFNHMQRWMRTAFLGHEPAVAPLSIGLRWQPGVRPLAPVAAIARTAVTPFRAPTRRRSYARVDPADRRRAVICGSPAQVCAVLEIMERSERA